MAKNNSKARKSWRRKGIEQRSHQEELSPDERLLRAIFGEIGETFRDPKPGTDDE